MSNVLVVFTTDRSKVLVLVLCVLCVSSRLLAKGIFNALSSLL